MRKGEMAKMGAATRVKPYNKSKFSLHFFSIVLLLSTFKRMQATSIQLGQLDLSGIPLLTLIFFLYHTMKPNNNYHKTRFGRRWYIYRFCDEGLTYIKRYITLVIKSFSMLWNYRLKYILHLLLSDLLKACEWSPGKCSSVQSCQTLQPIQSCNVRNVTENEDGRQGCGSGYFSIEVESVSGSFLCNYAKLENPY